MVEELTANCLPRGWTYEVEDGYFQLGEAPDGLLGSSRWLHDPPSPHTTETEDESCPSTS